MKQLIFSLFIGSAVFAVGCNANETKTAEKTTKKETTVATTANEPSKAQDKETKAIAEVCTCFNTFLGDMSPKVKEIVIAAGNSNNPMTVLTTELQKVKGEAEQEQLVKEFKKLENDQQFKTCSEDIKKKYNLDDKDTASRDRMIKSAEQNKDCEIVYALMKIGMQQQVSGGAIPK